MKVKIFVEDTDLMGLVYHTNYIKYCDRARTQLFFDDRVSIHDEHGGLVISKLEAKFLKPAKLGDTLEIKGLIRQLKKSSLEVYQEIFLDDTLIFTLQTHMVFIKEQRPSKIPLKMQELFKKHLPN